MTNILLKIEIKQIIIMSGRYYLWIDTRNQSQEDVNIPMNKFPNKNQKEQITKAISIRMINK